MGMATYGQPTGRDPGLEIKRQEPTELPIKEILYTEAGRTLKVNVLSTGEVQFLVGATYPGGNLPMGQIGIRIQTKDLFEFRDALYELINQDRVFSD